MELKDFTLEEQLEIKKGLPTANLSDKDATKKILSLVPKEWVDRIPFFIRKHAISKTIEKIKNENSELYEIAKLPGDFPSEAKEELRVIVNRIFEEKMKKHKI
jgi:hypothetical protein